MLFSDNNRVRPTLFISLTKKHIKKMKKTMLIVAMLASTLARWSTKTNDKQHTAL